MHIEPDTLLEEEHLVAELERLGIHYLSRRTTYQVEHVRPPAALLADLVRQPTARVREALIAVLLAHPGYAKSIPEALTRLSASEQLILRLFYTASVLLQQQYAGTLQAFVTDRWQELPDLFSADLGLPVEGEPHERLVTLGHAHRCGTKTAVNWTGTYENVARKLVRTWELEQQWKQ